MKLPLRFIAIPLVLLSQTASAIMERGSYPWGTKLRCFYDDELQQAVDSGYSVPMLLEDPDLKRLRAADTARFDRVVAASGA